VFFALALAAKVDLISAAEFANFAADIIISKIETVAANLHELEKKVWLMLLKIQKKRS
jgi:bifunctional ADP-heptose synthase (sugar kinase/adenylyltransferase)